MSCHGRFTDNPGNGQDAQVGDALKAALRTLADDLETSRDILKSAIERIASRPEDLIYRLFDEPDEDAKDVPIALEISGAFADFDWLASRAWHDFGQVIARETAKG